jgi:hypothetical protein
VKYDKEKHGDGLTVMVPMDVEPPRGPRIMAHKKYTSYVWFEEGGVAIANADAANGWTFAPALPPEPEPVKSYAQWLSGDDFNISGITGVLMPKSAPVKHPEKSLGLMHFIFDHLPTDKDRADILATLKDSA